MRKIFLTSALVLSLFGVLFSGGDKPKKEKKPKMTKEERAMLMQKKAEEAMKVVDVDGNGSVGLEEFIEWKKTEFAAKDIDGDGVLSAEEFVAKAKMPKKAKGKKAPKKGKKKKEIVE